MVTLPSVPLIFGLGALSRTAVTVLTFLGLLIAACGTAALFLLRHYYRIITDLFIQTQIPGIPNGGVHLDGEPVEFETADGVKLRGVFVPAPHAGGRTIIFCHEYGSNRNSVARYQEFLRPAGFNVFTFDFRAHGESANRNGYVPKQWMTTYEVADLEAAMRYVQGRPDVDPGKIGLQGLSRGACTCIPAAVRSDAVKAVVGEGVFATRQILIEAMKRWVSLYAFLTPLHPYLPDWFYQWLSRGGMRRAEKELGCTFVAVDEALSAPTAKPLLLIHGEKDSYVSVAHIRRLFEQARPPKELWVVPSAKHNEGVRVAGAEYGRRVTEFFRRYLK